MPKVSVIIPTYNRGNFILSAIESVLAQNYRNFEIIVVDDGSTDDTQIQLKKFTDKIKYFYQPNQGISSARNTGIRFAQGEYIAFLDSDDLWLGDKLMIQTQILDSDPSLALTYASMLIFDEKGHYHGRKPSKISGSNFQELIEKGGHFPTSTVMIRKRCFKRAGLFDENLSLLEDFDMWLRISRLYRIGPIVEQPLGIYRWHEYNIILDEQNMYESQIKLYQKILKQFPDAPVRTVKQKLARNQYLLSKIYFNEHNYKKAAEHLHHALINNPYLGKEFLEKDDNLGIKIFKLFKPYAFTVLCFFPKFFSRFERLETSGNYAAVSKKNQLSKEHLNICLLNRSFHKKVGGIETYTYRMAKALARRGHHVHIVTTSTPTNSFLSVDSSKFKEINRQKQNCRGTSGEERYYLEDLGMQIHVHKIDFHSPRFPGYWKANNLFPLSYYFYHRAAHKFLRNFIQENSIDIVEVPDFEGYKPILRGYFPLVVRLHGYSGFLQKFAGNNYRKNLSTYLLWQWTNIFLNRAQKTVAVSHNFADLISKTFRIHRDKVEVLYLGVDRTIFISCDRGGSRSR